MRRPNRRTSTTLAAIAAFALILGACGDDGDDNGDDTATEEQAAAEDDSDSDDDAMDDPAEDDTTDDDMAEDDMDDSMDESMSEPVGPGCADYAEAVPDGPGSVEGMSEDPVATAASNNPMLTTLVSAVSGELNPDVDLIDTLNGDEFTVFAPVDEAFEAVDEETLNTLANDADMLTEVLTYHVVPGQVAPDEIAGEHETVQGDTVMVEGDPEMLMVNDAEVICGGVETANAQVYLIDTVLEPSME